MTQPPEIHVVIHESVVVHPGDWLVIRMPPHTTAVEAHRLRRRLDEELPGVRCVLVPGDQLLVLPGPQLDVPARPLVEPPQDRASFSGGEG